MAKTCAGRLAMRIPAPFLVSIFRFQELQDVAAQILVLDDVRELPGDVGSINLDVLLLEVGRFERDFVQNLFEDGVEAAGADIFGLLVHAGGEAGDGSDRVFGDVELDTFGLQERDVLLDERILRVGQNTNKIFYLERMQLDANGKAPLELGDQIGRLSDVKGTSRDEQDVIRANHAVACVDGGAFDDGQNVALHAFPRDVRAMAGFAAGNLIDFIDEDDAHLFGALHGHARDLVHVQQLVFFFLDQVFESVGHAHFAFLLLLAEHAGKHVLDVDVHLLDALIGDDFKRGHGALADFEVDHALVELAFALLEGAFFSCALGLFTVRGNLGVWSAGRGRRRRRKQEIEHAFFRGLLGAVRDFVEFFLSDHVDGGFHKIADHRFHIAPHVTNFRVFRSFDLDEGAAGEAGQAARDFCLSHAGGANHQNVLGQNVFGDFRRKLLAADSIAQSDGDGALRRGLPGDVFVELGGAFPPRQIIESGEKFLPLDGLGAVASRCVGQFLFGLTGHELLGSFDARKHLVVFSRRATRFLPANTSAIRRFFPLDRKSTRLNSSHLVISYA